MKSFEHPGITVSTASIRRLTEGITRAQKAVQRFADQFKRATIHAVDVDRFSMELRLSYETDRRIRRRIKRKLKEIDR